MDQDITPEGQADGVDVAPVAPEGAVAGVADLSLEELNQHLGKNFKDKETALKSLKDTFSYVGKKRDDIAKEFGQEQKLSVIETELAKLRKDLWFKDNPDHAPNRALIEKLGDDPTKVIDSPEYKVIFEKVKGYDESQKLRTVLDSSPRIAAARDSFSKAKEAMQVGQKAKGEELVAQAVREAFKF